MNEFPIEDYLIEDKGKAKPAKKRPDSSKTRGQEALRAIELFDMSVRDLHRPLDKEEARKVEFIVDEAQKCEVDHDDVVLVHKVLDMIAREHQALRSDTMPQHGEDKQYHNVLLARRANPLEIAFRIGMAYERLETKGNV